MVPNPAVSAQNSAVGAPALHALESVVEGRFLQVIKIARVASRDIQFSRRPEEFILDIAVAVTTAARAGHIVGQHIRMRLSGSPGAFSSRPAALGEIGVDVSPDAGALRGGRGQIERGGGGGHVDIAA